MKSEIVLMSHGSGSGLEDLLNEVVLPVIGKPEVCEDAAVLPVSSFPLVMTSDSFVVSPLVFPGGNIGKLAACGTLNDIAMMGGEPQFISLNLIIEEGLSVTLLKSLLSSFKKECDDAGVKVVCGDTKVVDHGKADGLFISTTSLGYRKTTQNISAQNAKPGDVVIVNGNIAMHGIAILAARKDIGFTSVIASDCACLCPPVKALLDAQCTIHCMRDATRGGVAAVLHEIADASKVSITVDQRCLPVSEEVLSACSFLGYEPMHVANEGKFIIIAPQQESQSILSILKTVDPQNHPVVIGSVMERGPFKVVVRSSIGGMRPLSMPSGSILPRIC